MATVPPTSLPTREQIWERVHNFAVEAEARHLAVYTLEEGVENFVTDVKAGSVGRISANGKTNCTRVNRSMVFKVWDALVKNGRTKCPSDVLYFTLALMLAALPDRIRHVGNGVLSLRP